MATKKIDKELKKHIEEAMNKKREVSHAIVFKEPKEKQLKLLKELDDLIQKYNLQYVQTEDGWTFMQTMLFFNFYIGSLRR